MLGPTGYGALKLGMTSKHATATGLIAAWRGTAAAGCSLYSHVAGGNDDRGFVMYSGDTGVEVIDAPAGVSTPEGIHVGSTRAQLFKAYPDWANSQDSDPHADGVGATAVPGNSKAYYRIETAKGKVIQLTLQVANENCYE